tara:strand:+ start:4095 stop:4994 length:900 start_codon:yes stop_codon:yes gene_type:complete
MSSIWWEKHRPSSLKQFIGQEHLVGEMQRIIYDNAPMQHFIFNSTEAGTGKTTLAYILAKNKDFNIAHFNASSKRTRGIEFIEEDIIPLAQSGLNELIILLDEADQLTLAAQSALKGVIEGASCYFILTCNDLSKISPWLQSRCQVRTFKQHTGADIIDAMKKILFREGLVADDDALKAIANSHGGDLRNSIGALQAYSSLDPAEGLNFILRMNENFDARRFLRLTTKEKTIVDAVKLTGDMNVRKLIRNVFDYAVSSNAKPEMIRSVIESCVVSERDMVNGVDEKIVRYDFARMLTLG